MVKNDNRIGSSIYKNFAIINFVAISKMVFRVVDNRLYFLNREEISETLIVGFNVS
jgi:hypothetical protein